MFWSRICHFTIILYAIIYEVSTAWRPKLRRRPPSSIHPIDNGIERHQAPGHRIIDRSPTPKPTRFEIRAVLVKCSHSDRLLEPAFPHMTKLQKSPKFINEHDVRRLNGSKHTDLQIERCKKKVMVTALMHNGGWTDCKNQYVVIDHVYDPITNCKVGLFHPYVLKLTQQPVLQSYRLVLDQTVNGKAKEEVHNKDEPDYKGCHTEGSEATCQPIVHDGTPVPFSSGFCCSCDVKKYEDQQPSLYYSANPEDILQESATADNNDYDELKNLSLFALNDLGMPNDVSETDLMGYINSKLSEAANTYKTPGQDDKGTIGDRGFRSVRYGHIQKRGGQDCEDKQTPPGVDQDSYHQSAHCLKFSDVWYSVYHMEKPTLDHSIRVQVFEKFQDERCNVRWHDLSKGLPLTVGSDRPHAKNSGPTLAASYCPKTHARQFCPSIDVNQKLIMIPDVIKGGGGGNAAENPEVSGGPQEYLVVPKSSVSPDGKECNKAGVGFEAFNKQPNRCSVHQGSCLANQPSDMWKHDHEAESRGENGSYFLKYYGRLPKEPLKENCDDHSQLLSLHYEGQFSSMLELEFVADHNTALRPHSLAILTEVHVDSSNASRTNMRAKVTNSGLVASIFYVSLCNCPLDMPASFNNIASKPALIPPQHQHVFNLDVECAMPEAAFHCSLNVLNTKQEVLATRRVRIEPLDRCVCAWYCMCACLVVDRGMRCQPMSLDCFSSAGYQGSLPVPIQLVEYTIMDDVLAIVLYLCLFLSSTLLVMGLIKALVGWFCFPSVGRWGFEVLLEPPGGQRQPSCDPTQPVPPATEFCLNLIFFFVYPVMLLATMCARLCRSRSTKEGCERCYAEGKQWCSCGAGYDSCTCLPYSSQGPQEKPSTEEEQEEAKAKCEGRCSVCKCN